MQYTWSSHVEHPGQLDRFGGWYIYIRGWYKQHNLLWKWLRWDPSVISFLLEQMKNWRNKQRQILGNNVPRRDFAVPQFQPLPLLSSLIKGSRCSLPASVFPSVQGNNCGSLCKASWGLSRENALWKPFPASEQTPNTSILKTGARAACCGHVHSSISNCLQNFLKARHMR